MPDLIPALLSLISQKNMNRLEFLRLLGVSVAGYSLLGCQGSVAGNKKSTVKTDEQDEFAEFISKNRDLNVEIDKPVTVIVIGAGGRGNAYAGYAEKFPNTLNVIGVSDINEYRKNKMGDSFNIPAEHRFGDWSEVFTVPKFADAVIISTPDNLHFEPCMKALEAGYDVLLEKPIAPTEEECKAILAQSKKYNKIVGVCHVLHYAPYFVALKQALESGIVGDIVSVQHMEPILFDHMAHSYVRGNWHNSKETTPIILAKSCHDLDIIRWLVNQPCKSISADGGVAFFRPENAPADATERCLDCPHEKQCAYSAVNIYVRRHRMLKVFDLPKVDDALITEKLRTTNYGKCVFRMNNDQCDHYVANMVFGTGITAAFSMEAFTSYSGRRTRIMGTKGDIVGDMTEFVATDFLTHKKTRWNQPVEELEAYKGAGHGGGDWGLVRDFVLAVHHQDPTYLSSTVDDSVESHVMGFKAEESRLSDKKIQLS